MKDRATTKWYRRTILFSISTFGIGLLAGIAINWKHVFHIPKASPPTTKISLGLLNSYVVMLQRNYGHANDTFFSYIIDTTIANQLFRKCGRFRIYNEAHDVGGIINAGFYLVGVDAAGNDIPNLIFYQPKTDKCPKMCDPVSIAHTFVAGKVTNDLAAFANGINLFRSRNADYPYAITINNAEYGEIIRQTTCKYIQVYYGRKSEGSPIFAIAVGVDASGNNMVTGQTPIIDSIGPANFCPSVGGCAIY